MADETASSALNRLLYEPINQNKIAVVLLDDDAYEDPNFGGEWPLNRKHWEQAVQILACAGAKAIYIDILFGRLGLETTNQNQSLILANIDKQLWDEDKAKNKELFDYCKRLKLPQDPETNSSMKFRVPVYFAFIGERESWFPKETSHKVVAQWEQNGFSYPLSILVEEKPFDTPGLALAWNLRNDLPSTQSDKAVLNIPLWAQPAYKIAMHLTDVPPFLPLVFAKTAEARVIPSWSQKIPQYQSAWKNGLDAICHFEDYGTIKPIVGWGLWAWEKLPWNSPYLQPAQCPPFLTINLSQIINYDKNVLEKLNNPHSGVKDRIVIVGQSYKGVENYTPAPMHQPQQLASAYLHATVVENLLTMGPKFDQIGPYDWLAVLGLAILFSFMEASLKERGFFSHACTYCWLFGAVIIFTLACLLFRGLYWPYGLLPGASLAFTSSLVIIKVFDESKIYEWANLIMVHLLQLWKTYIWP